MLDFKRISYNLAHFPTKLEYVTNCGALWQANPEQFLLEVPAIARYLVTGGTSISVCPEPEISLKCIEYFMRMAPLAALAYRQGYIALHAAVAANEQGALLLAGDSGSGKSTLLGSLIQRGWYILSDDIALISLNDQNLPIVHPVSPEIALFPDSINYLRLQVDSNEYIDAHRQLYSASTMFKPTPSLLRGIVRLTPHSKPLIEIIELEKSVRFNIIGSMLYNSQIAEALCNRIDYFRCTSAIAQSVKLHVLCRPHKISVDDLTDYLVSDTKGQNVLPL